MSGDFNPNLVLDQIMTGKDAHYTNLDPISIIVDLVARFALNQVFFAEQTSRAAGKPAKVGFIDLSNMTLSLALHRLCVVSHGSIIAAQSGKGQIDIAFKARPKYEPETSDASLTD